MFSWTRSEKRNLKNQRKALVAGLVLAVIGGLAAVLPAAAAVKPQAGSSIV
jgi:hypothetical protein